MSEILVAYNTLAAAQGKDEVSSFKNLAAARAALKSLEGTTMTDSTETESTEATEVETSGAPGLDTPTPKGERYNSTGKRGPAQGIGKFAKDLIAMGKTNAEVLADVLAEFPTAKTTTNCIAFYRAKVVAASKVEAPAEEAAATEEAEA